MKIASVEAIPLEAPIQKPVERARQTVPIHARRCLLVRITTDEGLAGYGEGLTPVAPRVAASVVRDVFAPFLIGKDPLHTEPIWENLYSTNSSRGYTRGYQMIAISAVDIALWDLKGKILGQPIYTLLGGGFRDKIPLYTTGLMTDGEKKETIDLAREYYDKGFRAMKLKIGLEEERDLEIVRSLRETFGPEVKIMVDANGAYDSATAVKIGRKFDALGVFWFEEPVAPEDIDGMAHVRASLDMYVASGECEYTKDGFRELFLRKAIDVCQPDIARAGGITECKRIAALAQTFHIRYAPHAWGGALCIAATGHLVMTLPNFLLMECDRVPNPLRDELLVEPLNVAGGFFSIPDKPGLGIELDDGALKRFAMPL